MAHVSNAIRQKMETLFGMSSGYVLDFTNAGFTEFIKTCLGFDPYERYSGSKAKILRAMWGRETDSDIATLTLELLEHWNSSKLMTGEPLKPHERTLYDTIHDAFEPLVSETSAVELNFLERDFTTIRLENLRTELSTRDIVSQRLEEIDRCLKAEAPLAVIFLCGSTIEGLLSDLAQAQASVFVKSNSAPRLKGTVKQLDKWTLAELITVSHEQGAVGLDVVRHAHAVRDFRNYIHPRQQLREQFTPRMITAQIARQVLLATIFDLGSAAASDGTNHATIPVDISPPNARV